MDLYQAPSNPRWKPLNPARYEIRLLRVVSQVPPADQSIVHCQVEHHSLQDLSTAFSRFCLEHAGDEIDESAIPKPLRDARLRKRWITRHGSPPVASLEGITSHQPVTNLHRFSWGDFACLSYAWGDPTRLRLIYVDGQPVNVTENLEAALQQFLTEGMFGQRFLLWADALCINQDDREERAAEVQRMRDIYGIAWTVETWLGPAIYNSDAGFQLLDRIASFKEAGCEDELERHLRRDPHHLGSTGWWGLHSIMDLTYWYRLWIIQEVVLGGERVWMWCGGSKLSWATFCAGIATLQDFLWLVKDQCLLADVRAPRFLHGYAWRTTSLHLVHQDLSTLSIAPLERRPEFAFARLLDLALPAKCTDMRDKVYALLGLFPLEVKQLIHPDYSATLSHVFTQVARAFCRAYNNLEPLREGNPWGPNGCPSWAADWLWPGRIRHCRVQQRLWGPAYLFPRSDSDEPYSPFNASGERRLELSLSSDTPFLSCKGLVIDRISGLSAAGAGYFAWNVQTIVRPGRWSSIYGRFEETREALMRTLLMDRTRFGEKPSRRHRAIFHLPATFAGGEPQFRQKQWAWLAGQEGYYFRWEDFRHAIADFPLGPWVFDEFFSDEIPSDANEYDYTEVYACSERSVKKRRFMTTERGYMGWAPDNMFGDVSEQAQQGDLIAIIFGCSTPLAIRPTGETFQILGEAYVQGRMDGEAVENVPSAQVLTFS